MPSEGDFSPISPNLHSVQFDIPGEAMKLFLFLGALSCFLGVLAGALGAHGLKEYLIQSNGLNNFNLATDYMFYHGMGLLFVAYARNRYPALPFHYAGWLFVAGTLLFQGNLFLMTLTGNRMMAMLTPVGGVCLMAGWILFAFQALRISKSRG